MKTAVLAVALGAAVPALAEETVTPFEPRGAVINFTVDYPVAPDVLFEAATGDVSGWWDHHHSAEPVRFEIEPRPGGHFIETFDAAGNGAVHATVTYVQRPTKLQFSGPFGFAGRAADLVVTYDIAPFEKGSRLALTVDMAGHLSAEETKIVERVWRHFLEARLKTYLEAGCRGGGPCAQMPK